MIKVAKGSSRGVTVGIICSAAFLEIVNGLSHSIENAIKRKAGNYEEECNISYSEVVGWLNTMDEATLIVPNDKAKVFRISNKGIGVELLQIVTKPMSSGNKFYVKVNFLHKRFGFNLIMDLVVENDLLFDPTEEDIWVITDSEMPTVHYKEPIESDYKPPKEVVEAIYDLIYEWRTRKKDAFILPLVAKSIYHRSLEYRGFMVMFVEGVLIEIYYKEDGKVLDVHVTSNEINMKGEVKLRDKHAKMFARTYVITPLSL